MRFWATRNIEILVKKSKISVKIEILAKNRNFDQKSNFWLKIEIFLKNRQFSQKIEILAKNLLAKYKNICILSRHTADYFKL